MDKNALVEIYKIFFEEADINLDESEQLLIKLQDECTIELLQHASRLAHNLKGSSKAIGFDNISDILHEYENVLYQIQNGQLQLTKNILSTLFKVIDKSKFLVSKLKDDSNYIENISLIVQEIQLLCNFNETVDPNSTGEIKDNNENKEFSEVSKLISESEINEEALPQTTITDHEIIKPSEKNQSKKYKNDEIIRIPLSKIEKLQNYIGEIVIIESMINDLITISGIKTLNDNFRLLNKISKEVQNVVMGLRLIPIKGIYQKLSRTAYDASNFLSKEIRILFEGEEIEIDKFISDEISDPLMHMVRNAIDHGIEQPGERILKNKDEKGTLKISSKYESGLLVVSISDDGRGLDAESIYQSAVKKNVIKDGDQLSENECINLIFAPGFSTKSEATEISGRGVGMDVVKSSIEKLSGRIEINTEINKGTEFKIYIPSTIGIIDAFIVEINKKKYVIPVNQVLECLSYNKFKLEFVPEVGLMLNLRNEEIQIFDMSIGLEKSIENNLIEEKVIMIVKSEKNKIGILIDKIIKIQSVLTKPLGDESRCEKGFIGSVILGNGRVIPILNVSELVKNEKFLANTYNYFKEIKVTA